MRVVFIVSVLALCAYGAKIVSNCPYEDFSWAFFNYREYCAETPGYTDFSVESNVTWPELVAKYEATSRADKACTFCGTMATLAADFSDLAVRVTQNASVNEIARGYMNNCTEIYLNYAKSMSCVDEVNEFQRTRICNKHLSPKHNGLVMCSAKLKCEMEIYIAHCGQAVEDLICAKFVGSGPHQTMNCDWKKVIAICQDERAP